MGERDSKVGGRNLLWILIIVLFGFVTANDVVIEERQNSVIISKDEELIRKPIGPLNKYELLNSFPSMYSTEFKKKENNLLQVYDSNLIKLFPFLSLEQAKSISSYRPVDASTSLIEVEESTITIHPIDTELLFEGVFNDVNLGCSSLSNQKEYVISESMLNSGSFGHIWMAQHVRDQTLYILKRIRIEKGMESIFAARREIFMGLLFRGVDGIAQYEECFIQDIGLLMNASPLLPDRVVSIPWLVFRYEGVSLSQMIYVSSASDRARDDCSTVVSKSQEGYLSRFRRMWSWNQESSDTTHKQNQSLQTSEGMIVQPSSFWRQLREDDILFKTIIYRVLQVLEHIHQAGVIHRDIKPENILISHLRTVGGIVDYRSLSVKVIDFGSAILPEVPALYPLPASADQCTKLYAPPEAVNNRYSQSYDIWSVGVMMLEMIFGHKQFFDCEPRLYAKLHFHHGDLAERKCYSMTLRSYCVSAVEGKAMEDCVENVMQRTIRQRDTNYDKKGETNLLKLDLIRHMLVLDPKKRITVTKALQHPYFENISQIL